MLVELGGSALVQALCVKKSKDCGFCHKSMKFGTMKEYTTMMNFRYGDIAKSHPGYHGNHLKSAITEYH